MQGTVITGKQAVYTIVRQMPYSWNEKEVYYLCRTESNDYVLLYVCLVDEEPKDLGKYLFVLRNFCLHSEILSGHKGHESWIPIIEEEVTIPMGFSVKKGLIMRLDVKDASRLISLGSIFKSGKRISVLTGFWLMRELALFLDVAGAWGLYVGLYTGGILIDPEERQLVVYDFSWIGKRTKAWRNIEDGQWSKLVNIGWEILGFGKYSRSAYSEYEFVGEYKSKSGLLNRLGSILSHDCDRLEYLLDFLRDITNELALNNCTFVLQDGPVVQRKIPEEPEEVEEEMFEEDALADEFQDDELDVEEQGNESDEGEE